MIITVIKRFTLVALFSGVTIAGMISMTTDQDKANEIASIEVSRAQNELALEQAQAVATMTALDASAHTVTLKANFEAEKAALAHEIELERMTRLANVQTFAQGVFIALGTGTVCAVVLAGANSYRKRSEPLVTVRGLPVERRALADSQQMFALIEQDQSNSTLVRVEQARHSQAVPHTYSPTTTYAPRNSYEYENTVTGAATIQAEPTQQAVRVPTFAQLLRSGVIGTNQDAILYGFDEKQEQYKIDFDKLTSTLIFGNSGSGKTTTLANLIGQLALNGFDLQIIDPHFGHDESLSERLKPLDIDQARIAQTNEQIERQARLMLALLEKAKRTGEDVRTAWILDEVTAVLRNKCANIVQEALEAIAQEGRKYKLVAYAASQATRANRFGDSSVRDSFPIIALHRLRRSALRNVGLTSSDEFARVEKLSVGVFMLDDGKSEPLFLTAPMVDQSDLLTISGSCQLVLSGTEGVTKGVTEDRMGNGQSEEKGLGLAQEVKSNGSNAKKEPVKTAETLDSVTVIQAMIDADIERETIAAHIAKMWPLMSQRQILEAVGGSRNKCAQAIREARKNVSV